jgi:uncharacterized protein (DUF885 family)
MPHPSLLIALALAQAAPQTNPDASKQLSDLLAEHWEYTMRKNPEYASVLGDKRFNDQLSDFSEQAELLDIEAQRRFLARFKAIEVKTLSAQEALNHSLMVRQLEMRLKGVPFKDCEMPVTQFRRNPHPGAAARLRALLRDRQGLRRLHRQAAEAAHRVRADHRADAQGSPGRPIREQMLAAIRDGIRPAYQRFTRSSARNTRRRAPCRALGIARRCRPVRVRGGRGDDDAAHAGSVNEELDADRVGRPQCRTAVLPDDRSRQLH